MTRFDSDTHLSPVADGRFRARLTDAWWIERGPNGGFLAALMLKAMQTRAPGRPPRSLTVHYLAPPKQGDVEIATDPDRAGGSLATVSGRMIQGDATVALALAAFSPSWGDVEFRDSAVTEPPALRAATKPPFPGGAAPPLAA